MRTFARSILAATALCLAGCGYTPLYQPLPDGREASADRVQVGAVETANPERNVGTRRPAQHISEILRQDFPDTGPGMDTIKVTIQEISTELAIDTAATVERVSLTINATVTLLSPQGRVLLKSTLSTDAPYNVENNPYSTETGKVYARQTAAQNLADAIHRRIVLYYRQHPSPAPKPEIQPTAGHPAATTIGDTIGGSPGNGLEGSSNKDVAPAPDAPEQRFQPAPTL